MIHLKTEGLREFYTTYMRLQSVKYHFNVREISIAGELLYFRNKYKHSPLERFTYEGEDDKPIPMELSLMDQLKDKETLHNIVKSLDMSFVVLRKHIKGLKEKGFFKNGDIDKKFIPADNYVATFKLTCK